MTDVRRVMMTLPCPDADGTWREAKSGFHALLPWSEYERLKGGDLLAERRAEEILNYQAEIERLRKVADAAREMSRTPDFQVYLFAWNQMIAALRELEESDD